MKLRAIIWSTVVMTLLIVYPTEAQDRFLSFPSDIIRRITCNYTCYAGHPGIDFGLRMRDRVVASATGNIEAMRDGIPINTFPARSPYGNHVVILHPNGYRTIYGHLYPGTITVQVGDRVEAGQLLGLSDNTGKSTGPHLHFEVRNPSGRRVNPYGDPADYEGGCGPGALWATCPPTPAPPTDSDHDGWTTIQGDCNDANANIHPAAPELCNNKDENCDGRTDEPWKSGLASDIGKECTVGVGACANTGEYICTPDGLATVCNVDRLPPQTELCNQLDDDCDGETDENWRAGLAMDIGQPCTVDPGCGIGLRNGVWDCAPDGRATVCFPVEECNGIDDDCDGQTDNNISEERFRFDSDNCGSCSAICAQSEQCIQGHCMRSDCIDEICMTFCVVRSCSGCDVSACDLTALDQCRSRCPSDNLPRSRSELVCLCQGECQEYANGECR